MDIFELQLIGPVVLNWHSVDPSINTELPAFKDKLSVGFILTSSVALIKIFLVALIFKLKIGYVFYIVLHFNIK